MFNENKESFGVFYRMIETGAKKCDWHVFLYFFEYFLGVYLFVIKSLSLRTKLTGSESEKMDFNSFLQAKNFIILIPSLSQMKIVQLIQW